MDYARLPLADRLAAEYVLGTLRGPARRRFEALLPAHAGLRAGVAAWQSRLAPLAAAIDPVEPSESVWPALERRLFAAAGPAAAPGGWWQRLALWRGVAALATVAALGLGVVATQAPPVAPPIQRALVLRPIGPVPLAAGRALELWSVPGQGAPRSLGLVSAQGATTVLRTRLLEGTAAFAVSLEPAGGSPTGAPTGPVLSVGKLQS